MMYENFNSHNRNSFESYRNAGITRTYNIGNIGFIRGQSATYVNVNPAKRDVILLQNEMYKIKEKLNVHGGGAIYRVLA